MQKGIEGGRFGLSPRKEWIALAFRKPLSTFSSQPVQSHDFSMARKLPQERKGR